MRIKVLRRVGDPAPLEVEAALVVVETNGHQPVMVACEYGITGAFVVAHVNDPEFSQLVRNLGLGKTVLVQDLAQALKKPAELTPLIGAQR